MRQLSEETIRTIINKLGEDAVFRDEPMAKHTSMEVGGPVAFLFQPSSEEDLLFLLQALGEEKFPYYVKGNGSNLIFRDEGFDGAVIEIRRMQNVTITDDVVCAEAGILLKDLSALIEEASLTGFEFASGIPGSLGGAVCMNAGAYDGQMADVVTEALVADAEGLRTVSVSEMQHVDFGCGGGIRGEGWPFLASSLHGEGNRGKTGTSYSCRKGGGVV